MSVPLPPDENERLQTLARYEILDTPPDAELDRLTALAARLFNVPTALVSLVAADRQWFKSRHGFSVCETPRDQSFCAYAILPEVTDVLVVPDATLDPRFASNPLVTGTPGIRFYAGAPLRAPNGQALGSLCLIDLVPRAEFSDADRAALIDLAATTAALLELRLATSNYQRESAERQHAEARRQAMSDAALDGVITIDHEGRVLELNRAAEKMSGYTQEQAIGQELAELIIPPAYREAHRRGMAHFLATGEGPVLNKRLEPTAVRADGSEFPIELAITKIAAAGPPVFTGYIRDITDRRRTEEQARRATERVQTVLESITDAFYSLDREWRFTYVNEQAQRVLERPRGDLLGRSFWEVFPYKAAMAYHPEFHRALATGRPAVFELYSAPLKKWFGVHAYPSDEGLSVYVQDVTERTQAQRRTEDSHKLLRAIIDGTDNHIFIKDRDGRYLLMNPAGAALLGTTPAEAEGKDDSAFFPPASVCSNRAADEEVMRTGEMHSYESSDVIDGVEHVFLSTKSPYRDAAGNLLGIIGIARDITEQRRAAEALREAKEEAEEANLAKSEFLSRMSHELRTPLNAILGFGQLLELSDLGLRQTEGVNHILKAGRHLLGLIDEVLAISRIEAGHMNLSLKPVCVSDVVTECLSLVSRQAADRGLTLDNQCQPDSLDQGAFVQADRQRLRQVLLNLLSNAVKYNRDDGRVTVRCRRKEPDADGPPRLRLEVIDTGRGLTAAEIGRLFTPFERLGAERGPTEGTGLGLALSRGLIEAMAGQIGVDSVPGAGSTFWLELPLVGDPHEALNGVVPRSKSALERCTGTVLYVEDNLSNLRLIEILLEDHPGLELFSAQQGLMGLEIARARRPDLILLDLHLPDLPGWEVLGMLQADPDTRDIPVVVISADATPGRIERVKAAGAKEYMTKPIDVPTMLTVLQQYLQPRFPAKTPAMAAAD